MHRDSVEHKSLFRICQSAMLLKTALMVSVLKAVHGAHSASLCLETVRVKLRQMDGSNAADWNWAALICDHFRVS